MQPDRASAASRQTVTARTPRIGQPTKFLIPIKDFHG
jgi:hypothetical protein